MTFDSTVGGNAATSYASVNYADAYFATRPFSTTWNPLDNAVKQQWLTAATNRLEDEEASLAGWRVTPTQRLSQPRIEGYQDVCGSYVQTTARAGTSIDTNWLDLQCELAWYLFTLNTDPTKIDALSKFKDMALPSGLRFTLRDNNPRASDVQLPPVVLRKMRRFKKYGSGLPMVRM